jgi:hypothetical protein
MRDGPAAFAYKGRSTAYVYFAQSQGFMNIFIDNRAEVKV